LAHRLARRERRTVADVVERALEAYEASQTGREPAAEFYARLAKDHAADVDLEAELRQHRQVHTGPDLAFSSTPTWCRRRCGCSRTVKYCNGLSDMMPSWLSAQWSSPRWHSESRR